MALSPFQPIQESGPGASAFARVQEAVRRAVNPIVQVPILDGALLEAVALTTSAANVPHGLGRPLRGWWVVDRNADARVWRPSTTGAERYVTLQASAAVTVSLWVF